MAHPRPWQAAGEPLKDDRRSTLPTVPCQKCPRGQVPLKKRGPGLSMGSCTTCGRTYARISAMPRTAQ
jgi:hypothetical protein